jgi:hypothetical protein
MFRSLERVSEESLASAIGLLYQRKKAGAALIRVLEKYQRRGCRSSSGFPRSAGQGSVVQSLNREHFSLSVTEFQPKLEQLYLRREVVDELIRSIEAYVDTNPTMTGKRAGPQTKH